MLKSFQKIDVKRSNLSKVFRIIQKEGPIERKEIQHLSNLSWGAVSQFTTVMLSADIIRQDFHPSGKVGKNPSMLTINTEDNYVVGVDFDFKSIRAVLLDLEGNIIKSRVAAIIDGSRIIDILLNTLDDTLSEVLGKKNILTIGISTQGNIDEEKGIALYLTFDPSWRNLNLKQIVEDHFQIQTFVFHDPDCILIAEKYFGDAFCNDLKNVITLNMNYGVGMSLMIDSKIYNSEGGRHGELGHTTVVPNGALCSCGKRGCLEAYASKVGIINRFIEAVNNGNKTIVNVEDSFGINYETIRDAAKKGDPLCTDLFIQAGEFLGQSFSSLASIFNPDVIILFGEFANDRALYKDVMEKIFNNDLYPGSKTKLFYSELGGSATSQGAAFFALDKVLTDFLMKKTEVGMPSATQRVDESLQSSDESD